MGLLPVPLVNGNPKRGVDERSWMVVRIVEIDVSYCYILLTAQLCVRGEAVDDIGQNNDGALHLPLRFRIKR
jgi:hypothetical protein